MSKQWPRSQNRPTKSKSSTLWWRLKAVESWTSLRFQQVIARHKYERLYESVLSPVRTRGLEFEVPNDDLLKRILGIEKTDIEVMIPDTCPTPSDATDSVHQETFPSNIEQICELTVAAERVEHKMQMRPPVPPPLYPPIWDQIDVQYYYLQYGSHPLYDRKTGIFQINNQRYRLDTKSAQQYVWDYFSAFRPDPINWQDLDQTSYRLANDYRIYRKTDTRLGMAYISYFRKI